MFSISIYDKIEHSKNEILKLLTNYQTPGLNDISVLAPMAYIKASIKCSV